MIKNIYLKTLLWGSSSFHDTTRVWKDHVRVETENIQTALEYINYIFYVYTISLIVDQTNLFDL